MAGCSSDDKIIKVSGHDLIDESLINSEVQEITDSPMSEYIKCVEFAELPGSPRQAQGFPGLSALPFFSVREVSSIQTVSSVDVSPLKKKALDSHDLSSIWEKEDKQVKSKVSSNIRSSLDLKSSEEVGNDKNLSKIQEVAVNQKASSSMLEASSTSNEPEVKEPLVSVVAEEEASEPSECAFKRAEENVVSVAEVDSGVTSVTRDKEPSVPRQPFSVGKIKRAFSAIISPPSKKNRGPSEGPKLKKKN